MKGFLLALAMNFVCFGLITAIFRAREVRGRAALMAQIFLLILPCFVAVHVLSPADLSILPPRLTASSLLVDLAFGLLVYGAGFFGGILQLYNLADRGFSLRILIDIAESQRGMLSLQEIIENYSGGRGLDWMYQKRLQGLVEQGLVRIDREMIHNSERGRRAAALFGWLQAFLRVESTP